MVKVNVLVCGRMSALRNYLLRQSRMFDLSVSSLLFEPVLSGEMMQIN